MLYQLGSSMMDALVLSIVAQKDSYGYQISQRIKRVSELKESTLYPVLRRLQEAGYLDTYDQPFQGRNRKYYRITGTGVDRYGYCLAEWESYKTEIDKIIKGGEEENE